MMCFIMFIIDIIYMVMVIHDFLLSMLRFERPDILASPRPFVVLRASFGNRHETAISLSPGGGEVGKYRTANIFKLQHW